MTLVEILKETRSNACDKKYGFTIEQAVERIKELLPKELETYYVKICPTCSRSVHNEDRKLGYNECVKDISTGLGI